MKKMMVSIGIIAAFVLLQACSKKETGPVATGYEGFWTGRMSFFNPDSIQLNLKLGGLVDGKLFISPNGSAEDTVHGKWAVIDTLITMTTINTKKSNVYTFFAKADKDSLNHGKCLISYQGAAYNPFKLARKK